MIMFISRFLIDYNRPRKICKHKILVNDGIINREVISVVNRSQLNGPK